MSKATSYQKRATDAYRARLAEKGYMHYSRRIPREFVAKLDALINKLKKSEKTT